MVNDRKASTQDTYLLRAPSTQTHNTHKDKPTQKHGGRALDWIIVVRGKKYLLGYINCLLISCKIMKTLKAVDALNIYSYLEKICVKVHTILK